MTTTAPITTYWEASSAYLHTGQARERHDALSHREQLDRAYAKLRATGAYDWAKHGAGDTDPLTVAEHLELLATGAVVAHYYRHPASVHHAVEAGASWEQIAAALDISEDQARAGYRRWADSQHQLWLREGRWGLCDADHAAAIERAGAGQASGDDDDQAVILAALEDAVAAIRERAAYCTDCQAHPADLCDATADQLRRAAAYDALAGRLGGAR